MNPPPFNSPIILDIGMSMGDEGKGRLVYEIIDDIRSINHDKKNVQAVIKVNGGANAGHTAAGLKLNLLPSGVADASIPYLIVASGVVADPCKFHWECKPLEKNGLKVYSRLVIDERTMISDLTHRLLDLAWEYYRTHELQEQPRGSTGRGISPAYADEGSLFQMTYSEYLNDFETYTNRFNQRIRRAMNVIEHVCRVPATQWFQFLDQLTQAELRANQPSIDAGIFSSEEFNFRRFATEQPFALNAELLIQTYWQAGSLLATNVQDARELLLEILQEGGIVVGEFGQSYWLDKRHGFVPNVTASHTFTPEFFLSTGIPLQPVHALGACKAYDTKVGTHLFLTQMPNEHPLASKLKKMEFGTSTGRQRMIGWFDAVEKADALRYVGFNDIALNKLDALSYSEDWQEGGELLICNGYRLPNGKTIQHVPRDAKVRAQLKPTYIQLPGWSEDISKIHSFEKLPLNAQRYVAEIMNSIITLASRSGISPTTLPNLRYIGVGPELGQVIRNIPPTKELLKGTFQARITVTN